MQYNITISSYSSSDSSSNCFLQKGFSGIKLVEWNNLVTRVLNINSQVGGFMFFWLLKNNGEFIVNSMYKHLVNTSSK